MSQAGSWQDLRDEYLRALSETGPEHGPGEWLRLWRLLIEHPWYQQQLRAKSSRVLRQGGLPLAWRDDLEHDAMLLLAGHLRKAPDLGIDRALAEKHFAGWMGTIITRDCLMAARRLRRHYTRTVELSSSALVPRDQALRQARTELSLALEELPEPQQSILQLYAKGLSLRQIAGKLQLGYWATYRLYHNGLERLRADW